MLCHRGCGLVAKYYTKKNLPSCSNHHTKCPTVRKKIGKSNAKALIGRTLSDKHKQSISGGLKGRVVSEKTRKQISESNKLTWENNPRVAWNKGIKTGQIPWNKGMKKKIAPRIVLNDDPAYKDFKKIQK